ncbi:MAG: hypothetical protein ACK5LZ_04315 [Anaerorhabdus sp.]
MQEQLKYIYSSETDSYFQFTGKQTLSDILNLDRNSYFDKREIIIETIMAIQDVEVALQQCEGFKSNEEDYSGVIKKLIPTFEEKMSVDNRAMHQDLYADVLEQVDVSSLNEIEKGMYHIGVAQYFNNFGRWGRTDFHRSVFSHLEGIEKESVNLSTQYTEMEEVYYKVQSVAEQIEDITKDLEYLVADLAAIQFENIGTAIDELKKVTKQNYLLSGEVDIDVLDTSLMAEDKAFVEQAKQREEIDLYFDLGLIDDGLERGQVRYEELGSYVEHGKFEISKVEAYIETNPEYKDQLERIHQVLGAYGNHRAKASAENPDHEYTELDRLNLGMAMNIVKELEVIPEGRELYDLEIDGPLCTIIEQWKEPILELPSDVYPMYSEVGATGIQGEE